MKATTLMMNIHPKTILQDVSISLNERVVPLGIRSFWWQVSSIVSSYRCHQEDHWTLDSLLSSDPWVPSLVPVLQARIPIQSIIGSIVFPVLHIHRWWEWTSQCRCITWKEFPWVGWAPWMKSQTTWSWWIIGNRGGRGSSTWQQRGWVQGNSTCPPNTIL